MILLTSSDQTACQQELNEVLEEISRMTSEDNRGPLENLYRLKFPNCDKDGLYSLKQVRHAEHTWLIWLQNLHKMYSAQNFTSENAIFSNFSSRYGWKI